MNDIEEVNRDGYCRICRNTCIWNCNAFTRFTDLYFYLHKEMKPSLI